MFAISEGVLTGFILAERYLSTVQPLPFLMPFLVAIIGNLVADRIGNSRKALLCATLGTTTVVYLMLGTISGQISFSYVTLVVLYGLVGLASIQQFFKDGDFSPVSYIFYLIYINV